jgi:hypothetical protein
MYLIYYNLTYIGSYLKGLKIWKWEVYRQKKFGSECIILKINFLLLKNKHTLHICDTAISQQQ